MTTSNPSEASRPKSPFEELRKYGLIGFAKWAAYFVGVYATFLFLFLVLEFVKPETAGQFGDAFGVLTSLLNALALAGVVATVVLQSKELEENRELTKSIEANRIRPFLKVEFMRDPQVAGQVEFRIRNVGLGVAIVESIELIAKGTTYGLKSVTPQTPVDAMDWGMAIGTACELPAGHFTVDFHQFDELNRALEPGEYQALFWFGVLAGFPPQQALRKLSKNFRPVINFASADGTAYNTNNQFDAIRAAAQNVRGN